MDYGSKREIKRKDGARASLSLWKVLFYRAQHKLPSDTVNVQIAKDLFARQINLDICTHITMSTLCDQVILSLRERGVLSDTIPPADSYS